MEYNIGINAIGQFPELKISRERFLELKKCKDILHHGLEFEMKYEMILLNYEDYERAILSTVTQSMIRNRYDYFDFYNTIANFNQKYINLLSSIRLYQDTIHRHIKIVMNDKSVKTTVAQFFSTVYDSSLEYRFMYEFRNHVQHYSTAIEGISFPTKWEGDDSDKFLSFSLNLSTSKDILIKNKIIKKV